MQRLGRAVICALAIGILIAPSAKALSLNLGPVGVSVGGGGATVTTGGGGNTNVPQSTTTVNLLGDTTSASAGTTGTQTTGNVSLGLGGLLKNLFGSGNGTPLPPDGGGGGGGGGSGGGGVLTASLGPDPAACFVPDAKQVSKLLHRHTYSSSTVRTATSVEIVKVPLCPEAKLRLAQAMSASINLQRLHDAIEGRDAVRSWILDAGYAVGDVIAVDRSGKKLVIYVI
ncbi:MAG TPA: hypothetical protein VG757_14980 [Devosia sp.]|nr:hypothetical protein [Devosia sp.]